MNALHPPAEVPLSLVIPFFNEAGNVEAVIRASHAALEGIGPGCELLAVDDASTDGTGGILDRLAGELPALVVLHFARNSGQGAALWAGLHRARGRRLAVMDGDGQNDPSDLPFLLARLGPDADMVVGIRQGRKDTVLRRAMSRTANTVRRPLLGDGVRDAGCALKVFRREVLAALVPMRLGVPFMPAWAVAGGFRVAELPVRHHERRHGASKYGLRALWLLPLLDTLALAWLRHRVVRVAEVRLQDGPGPGS